MKSNRFKNWKKNLYLCLAANMLLLMVCYMVCRVVFFAENAGTFSVLTLDETRRVLQGGLRFDWAAVCYTNILYLVLLMMPLPYKETHSYGRALKVLFVAVNSLCMAANLMDAVYYQYVGRRTTASVFAEFKNDNVAGVIGLEFLNHWYLVLVGVALGYALWRCYLTPDPLPTQPRKRYYIIGGLQTILVIVVAVFGIRGGFDPELRPINNRDAKDYVSRPSGAALVLNTPFSICRTIGKKPYVNPGYFDAATLKGIYSPVHQSESKNQPALVTKDNVVLIVMESFASEYSARLNCTKERGEGYMPFLDSLMNEGLTFEHSFAAGRKSVDAQAAVLASIPMFVEPFFTSHAAMNDVDGWAGLLRDEGYATAYFHGADNGSLGIDGFARTCGFQTFHGRTEFADDSAWDHHWGIWDEEFMQYFGRNITQMPEPFAVGLFTLTSHHPFRIPERYRERFPEGSQPIYKTIRYADMALQRFFDYAKRQPWYHRTLFVITGDHTNQSECARYQTDKGRFEVPILFYHPSDKSLKGVRGGIASHIDIMPTILGYLGYSKPYVAFGSNLLEKDDKETWAVNYQNDIYQLYKDGLMLQHDGVQPVALYDYVRDPMLENNLLHQRFPLKQQEMETQLKAIIQQYMERMNGNRLTIKSLLQTTP